MVVGVLEKGGGEFAWLLNRFLICFVRAAWAKIEFERARV